MPDDNDSFGIETCSNVKCNSWNRVVSDWYVLFCFFFFLSFSRTLYNTARSLRISLWGGMSIYCKTVAMKCILSWVTWG